LRAPAPKKARRAAPPKISARLLGHVALEAQADGKIAARFEGYSVGLGTFGADTVERVQELRLGLALDSFAAGRQTVDKEIDLLVRRLARHGLLEYRFGRPDGADLVVIEPQAADYWPGTPELGDSDVLVLSRFAYMRRRGDEMVLESPRAGALFNIGDTKIAATLALLSKPQKVRRLRRQEGFAGIALLALLVDCHILFKIEAVGDAGLRAAEGDENLVMWDFHDLMFHTRSSEGRQANPLGGVYPFADTIAPLPAVRQRWPGKKIDLTEVSAAPALSPLAKLVRERHSTRDFDEQRPITLAELSRFLDRTARVLSTWQSEIHLGDGGPIFEYAVRPYPAAGASYELELYLTVNHCEGLARGFYHYDAGGHSLVAIDARPQEIAALLAAAEFAMGASAAPQIVVTIAARFGRISWKYSSIAYALILKDVGVLLQTFYMTLADMGLGGCAIGSANIDLFAKMTGIEFHVEGPVGQFAMGRGPEPATSD
jgi:SagB-type dehydrogenase family enzyme